MLAERGVAFACLRLSVLALPCRAQRRTQPRNGAALVQASTVHQVNSAARSPFLARHRLGVLLCCVLLLEGCSGWLRQGSPTAFEAKADNQEPSPASQQRPWLKLATTDEPSAVFLLNGEPFCFQGSNNYYLIFKSKRMAESVFDNATKIGLRVLRHWAFTDRGSVDGRVAAVDPDGTKEGVYFQYWDPVNQRPAYNDGANGLERLDQVVAEAREAGIRMVLVLTNNWRDFGGMDQYLVWYGLHEHAQFYTDERVKRAYKDWIAHLVNRVNTVTGIVYKDDPYVFAWELANEPRTRNYKDFDSADGWDKHTISTWAEEMTAFVRSLDPNHLIAVGDEGFFSRNRESFYNGDDGVDHDALLALPEVDYGTFHLYPETWGTGLGWGGRWIVDHLEAARKAGKPSVLEEYGVVVERDAKTDAILQFGDRRERAYELWNELMLRQGGAGSMFWMLAGYDDVLKKNYKDYDHFSVYSPETDPSARLLREYAQRFAKEARACQLARKWGVVPKRPVPTDFVTVSVDPRNVLSSVPRTRAEHHRE